MDSLVWNPIGNTKNNPFKGHYNGNNKYITGLAPKGGSDCSGLFGYATNAIFENVIIKGVLGGPSQTYTGALCAKGVSISCVKCINQASITNKGMQCGGLVGDLTNGTLTDCVNKGNITADGMAGGLIGQSSNCTFERCSNSGKISSVVSYSSASAFSLAGGLVANGGGTFTECYNIGNVSSNYKGYNSQSVAYGICSSATLISNCFVRANVTASGWDDKNRTAYGFVESGSTSVQNCYFAGKLSGVDTYVSIGTNSYYDSDLFGSSTTAGAKTTAQMKSDAMPIILNGSSSSCWKKDINSKNNGYPILSYMDPTQTLYAISANAVYGTVSGAGDYASGTSVVLTATPNSGYKFIHWSDGNTDNPRTIIVSGNATYTAIFRAESSSNNLIFTSYQNSSTIGLASLASHQVLEYSIDGINWINMTTTTTISLNNGESIYIRGVLSDNNTSTDYTQFSISGAIAVYGNINYLWNYQELEMPLKEYCGTNLFRDCTGLIYAPSLPAATLTRGCYNSMFRNCANLQSAPSLPATILASECYKDMFHDCIHLSSAPSLPATELAGDCYCSMFYGCSSLDSAPALPAEKLAYRCYGYMFKNCTSLTIAPALPAKELANYCYWRMFLGCSALSQVPEILPAKELTTYCYSQMFMQTAITRAPELPAKTLGEYSYYQMFYQCNKLKYIKCLATDISATGCTQGWVNGVATSGTFVKNSQMSSWSNGNDGIPNGWTIQDYAINEYVVNFVDWDGTIIKTEQVIKGSAATAPTDPIREGYTFIGWDKNYGNVIEDLTITAQYEWGENANFIIVFNNSEGDEILSNDIVLKVPAAPKINGFIFLGWRPKAIIIDNNMIEIEAVYKADEATISQEVITNPSNSAQKLIRDGNVYVLFDNKTYTITGQEIK